MLLFEGSCDYLIMTNPFGSGEEATPTSVEFPPEDPDTSSLNNPDSAIGVARASGMFQSVTVRDKSTVPEHVRQALEEFNLG
jgi:hypothetical protein